MRGPGAGRPRQAGSLGRGLPEAGPQASGGPLSRASPPRPSSDTEPGWKWCCFRQSVHCPLRAQSRAQGLLRLRTRLWSLQAEAGGG